MSGSRASDLEKGERLSENDIKRQESEISLQFACYFHVHGHQKFSPEFASSLNEKYISCLLT